MSVMSRAEYDEHRVRMNMAAGMGGDEARTRHEASYPLSTQAVMFELQKRGLDATDWRIQRLTRTLLTETPFVLPRSSIT